MSTKGKEIQWKQFLEYMTFYLQIPANTFAMRKICPQDEAGSKIRRSDMFIALEYKQYLALLSSISNVLTSFKISGMHKLNEVKSTVLC